MTHVRHIDIDGTHHTRDLGGWPLERGGRTVAGRVWRSDGIGRITESGRDALAGHGVRSVIDYARDAYRQVFDRIEQAASWSPDPVVVHCTVGKDRTGLVTALLLRAAGVDDNVVADEYAVTDARIGALRERLRQGAALKGIPEASYARLLEARRETMLVALAAMDDELVAAAQGAAQALLEQG